MSLMLVALTAEGQPPQAGPNVPYGNVFSVKLGGLRQVVLLGPEYPKLFFKSGDDTLSFNDALKARRAVNFHLFLDNKTFEYPIHITLIKQKFTPNMRNWTPLIAEVIEPAYVDGLLRNLGGPYYRGARKGTMVVEIERMMYQIVGRSSARCICGDEGYDNQELIDTFINFDKDATEMIGLSTLLPRFLGGRVKEHYAVMMKHLLPVVKKRRAAKDTSQKVDFLSYLLEAPDVDGSPLTDEWIVTRLGVMIWASLTTTAGALTQTLLDIFSRPEIREKVLEEQNRVLGDSKTVDHDHVKQMDYLDACIRESLRTTSFLRWRMKDMQAGQYSIQKGTMVALSAYVAHHDKTLWGEDTESFKPERFISETQPLYAFLPFGSGQHACPGRFFALHEIKTILSLLMRTYDIDIPGGRPKLVWLVNRVTAEKDPVIFMKKAAA
ncbi:cytochrome p450 superfamily protein [Acanthamoeba castellanii str. Neff]|uniref:Cytochrome p450 superfamily protein n=1 Tax=Acanthamoeba castellanii (strain ATCC 30010 / Neff) TaxID=1257118 RepID=L8H8R3_ACACF|nr:cytochrome p450 superfamily protein [Acanthamoeba castellanii str. Neff]ELR21914.1 cytochrome p450 superfamily protein [Acanthamoeba castellanii str. Neff]